MAGNTQRRGRPAGSKNIEYVIVEIHPTHCGKCGCTKFTPVKGAAPTIKPYRGSANGKPFNKMRRQRSMCAGCGQRTTIVERIFEPDNSPDI